MNDRFRKIPVLDCHIHFGHPSLMDGLVEILDRNQVARFNLVCTPHRTRLSLTPDALYVKAHHPGRCYVFGGLDISPLFYAPQSCGDHFAGYVDRLIEMGCDGVKMIEGKPEMRKTLPIPPFDSPAYTPYWEKLEETGLPLIFHVNDPEEFWNAEKVPDWASQQGWFYGDGTYINNEAQYSEVLNVLQRHPGLKVIFAHFFFLSAQLDRLAGYLDRFPGMHIDLTPGIEMYHNFARSPEKTRDFFLRYQDRILYGTDIGAKALLSPPGGMIEPDESRVRVDLVRSFLEKEGAFQLDTAPGYLFGKFGGSFQGIHLPDAVLEKIYHQNFEKLADAAPRPLHSPAVIAECYRLKAILPSVAAGQAGDGPDYSVLDQVLLTFEKKALFHEE